MAASRNVFYMAYIAHVVTGVWYGEVGIAMPVCVLFVFNRSDVIFNPSFDATTDHSQSVKNLDPYLSPSSVWMIPVTESL